MPGALGPPGPVTLSRERTGNTASLGESGPVLVTPQLLESVKKKKKRLLGLYISLMSLANVSLPCKPICALVLAQQ